MSVNATRWANQQTGLSPRNQAVLKILARHHNGVTGRCDPSTQQIAAKLSLSTATVKRATAHLQRAGLIVKKARWNRSNWYTLNLAVTVIRPAKPAPDRGSQTPDRGSQTPDRGSIHQIGDQIDPLTSPLRERGTHTRKRGAVPTQAYKPFAPVEPTVITEEQHAAGRARLAALLDSFK